MYIYISKSSKNSNISSSLNNYDERNYQCPALYVNTDIFWHTARNPYVLIPFMVQIELVTNIIRHFTYYQFDWLLEVNSLLLDSTPRHVW